MWPEVDHPTDAELVEDARHGKSAAFDTLFWRHYAGACDYASRFAAPAIAPDRAAEGFVRVYRVLREGQALDGDFEAALHSAVRSAHADVVRRGRREVPVEPEEWESADHSEDDLPIRRAFARLRPSWRRALWHTVVLGASEEELARRWGSTPQAVAALSARARRAMREACRAEQVREEPDLGAVLTPSLLLAVPGLVGRDAVPEGALAGALARLTVVRRRPVATVGVVVAATAAIALVVALTADPDGGSTATAAPESTTSGPGTPIMALPPFDLSEQAVIKPSAKSPSSATGATPSEDVETPTATDPEPSTEPTTPTAPPETPAPAVAESGASVTRALVRSARVSFEVTPAGADRVLVRVSNAFVVTVSGIGVRCATPSADAGSTLVVCTVPEDAPSTFAMTVRAGFARQGQPVAGSVTVTGPTGTASDDFSVSAD